MGLCRIGCDNMFNMEKKINRRENNEGRRQEGRSFSRNTRNSGYKSENKESSQTNRRYFDRERKDNENKPRFNYTREEGSVRQESESRYQRRPRVEEGRKESENGGRYQKRDYYKRETGTNPANRSQEKTPGRRSYFSKPTEEKNYSRENKYIKRDYKRQDSLGEEGKEELRKKHYSKKKQLEHHRLKVEKEDAELRLNRYISMGGVCSRRDADVLIAEGRVKVNGEVVQTVGIKVRKNDRVEVDDVLIVPERKVYLVLNKPKDYVTTVEDPLERKTVMSLIEDACKERIYPIGRLDRQTTGVLLFTNDGDLAKKLTHPKYEHKKIYHVFLNKPLDETDLEKISKGLELEDGFIKADEISYTSPDRSEVGIEIHSGRNRIVRRIFEHLGYDIVRLDRVYFAGITKKNLPRGRWRFLTSQEVRILKIYNT